MTARVVGHYRWLPGQGWEVEAEPDVMVRLKRNFPRVRPTAQGTLILSATLEVARDLEWFTDRYPMRASAADRKRLRAAATEHRRTESAVQDLLAGRPAEVVGGDGWVTPTLPLYDYQRTARDLIWTTGGTLVADELGAGKTLMGLSLLERPDARPGLAVTLSGTMPRQWRRQLKEFYPSLTSLELQNGEMHSLQVRGRVADLIVCNYAKLQKWQYHLKGLVKTVIFDEAQELRRSDSFRYEAAATIAHSADFATALTGTPVYNYGGAEIYNIVDIVRPGVLGSRDEFAREWCHTSGLDVKTMVHNPTALNTYLIGNGLMLRRPPEVINIHVPPVQTLEQPVPSDPKVLSEIEGNAVELARLILSQSSNPRERWNAAGQFDVMMRQQTGIAKAPFVADFVKMLLQTEQKVILLGWHHACHRIWMERLAEYNPCLYTGAQTDKEKNLAIDRFTTGDCRVLIMSVRSGVGIDGLQKVTSTLVFGELDWSPGPHKQAIGRCRRPGQTKRTMAYFCTTDVGSDPVMIEVLDTKTLQAELILNERGGGSESDEDAATPLQGLGETRYQQIQRIAASYLASVQAERRSA